MERKEKEFFNRFVTLLKFCRWLNDTNSAIYLIKLTTLGLTIDYVEVEEKIQPDIPTPPKVQAPSNRIELEIHCSDLIVQ